MGRSCAGALLRSAVAGSLVTTIMLCNVPWAVGAVPAEPMAELMLARPSDEDLAADASVTVNDDLPVLSPDALDSDSLLLDLADTVDALPVERSEIEALAASLGADIDAAFRFVRDEVRIEPYAGTLRGARGTLAARAGNAIDRAMLLHDVLEAMGHEARFAFAELDETTAANLLESAVVSGAERAAAADLPDLGPIDLAAVRDRARRDHARLLGVLGDRVAELGDAGLRSQAHAQAARDVSQHAWVQVELDGAWVDLDPTLVTSQPGETLVPASVSGNEIPPEMRQAVTLRLVAETLTDGYVEEYVALERRLDSALAAEAQIILLFAPGESQGGGFFGGVEAPTTYAPLLLVDGVADVGAELPVAQADGGGFSDLGGFGGGGASDLVGLRLEVVREAPGHEPTWHTRVLLDRVPPDVRASGAVSADVLPPQALSGEVPVALAQVHHIVISDGGADPRAAAIDRLSADHWAATELADGVPPDDAWPRLQLWPLTALDESLALVSERAVVESLRGAGVISFVGRPRVTVVTLGPTASAPDGLTLTVDLMVDEVSILAAPGVDPAEEARARLWYGVVQSAMESEFVRLAAVASIDPSRSVLSASLAGDAPLTLLAPTVDASVDATVDAAPAVLAALDAGDLVVVPGDPATAPAWWTVSPGSGVTRAVLDPALGGASVFFGAGPNYLQIPGSSIMIERSYMQEADRWGGVEYQVTTNLVAVGTVGAASSVGAYIAVGIAGLAVGVALVFLLR